MTDTPVNKVTDDTPKWWWWFPGFNRKWRLAKKRAKALAEIRVDRSLFEEMADRPRPAEDALDKMFVENVLRRLSELQTAVQATTDLDALDDLIQSGKRQGQQRAYICPVTEIEGEGALIIPLLEEWGIPKALIEKQYKSHADKLTKAKTSPGDARGALRALFEEKDSWEEYAEEYEDQMTFYAWILSPSAIILPGLAFIAFHFASTFPLLLALGILLAGAAGSCLSVLAKMPVLDIALSSELESYGRRILIRIAVGVGGSVIGCAFLAWGMFPIAFQNQTFADLLNSCLKFPSTSLTALQALILLGFPMLFGFSERALTSFEQRVFGKTGQERHLGPPTTKSGLIL
jgi:hypothetical protein